MVRKVYVNILFTCSQVIQAAQRSHNLNSATSLKSILRDASSSFTVNLLKAVCLAYIQHNITVYYNYTNCPLNEGIEGIWFSQ